MAILQAILILFSAPLLAGVGRVTRARVQTRRGPPLMQQYYDLLKLMKRQEVVSEQAGWVFRITPYLSLACYLLAAMLIPMLALQAPLGPAGDLIVVVYLFAIPRFFFSLAGLEAGNPFAGAGARREQLMAALVEPTLLLSVFVLALLAGSTDLGAIAAQAASGAWGLRMAYWLSLAAFAFALYVELGRLPYDMAEAEQEVQEGPLAEYSGRALALMKWGQWVKQAALLALFIALYLPWGMMAAFSLGGLLPALALLALKLLLLTVAISIIENLMARVRFAQAPALTWLALGAALLSFVFYLVNV